MSSKNPYNAPIILWCSNPVLPDETILLQDDSFEGPAVLELAEISEGEKAHEKEEPKWVPIEAVQKSERSLKAVVPAQWPIGLYPCRVRRQNATSSSHRAECPRRLVDSGRWGTRCHACRQVDSSLRQMSQPVGSKPRLLGFKLGQGNRLGTNGQQLRHGLGDNWELNERAGKGAVFETATTVGQRIVLRRSS